MIFIRDILDELNNCTGIQGGYIVENAEDLDNKSGVICIEKVNLIIGRQIYGCIKGTSQVAMFLCAAGEVFTRMTNQLNEQGDIMDAYLLDAVGSLTVENAMDKIRNELQKNLTLNHFKISNRYSPGYC